MAGQINEEMLLDAKDLIDVARDREDPMERIAACLAAFTSIAFVATNIFHDETKIGGAFTQSEKARSLMAHYGGFQGAETGRFKGSKAASIREVDRS